MIFKDVFSFRFYELGLSIFNLFFFERGYFFFMYRG